MRTISITLVAMAATLGHAGTFSVEPAQWQGGAAPGIFGATGQAGASLSGTTASWFAKFPPRSNAPAMYVSESHFNGVQATVSWKIVWTPSTVGETPPTSESVVVRAKGKIFAFAQGQCGRNGHVSANVKSSDAALGMKEVFFDGYGSATSHYSGYGSDGSETQEVYRDFFFSGTHAAQFSPNGSGGAYAYIAVPINCAAYAQLSLNYGGSQTSWLEAKGGIDASMKPIVVGNQNVSGDSSLPGSGGPGTGGPVLPGTGPG